MCIHTRTGKNFSLGNFENNVEKGKPEIDFSKLEYSKFSELTIRYTYHNRDKTNFLFQAGGAGGVDCALYSRFDNEVSMIELKEPYARTSDANLPKIWRRWSPTDAVCRKIPTGDAHA